MALKGAAALLSRTERRRRHIQTSFFNSFPSAPPSSPVFEVPLAGFFFPLRFLFFWGGRMGKTLVLKHAPFSCRVPCGRRTRRLHVHWAPPLPGGHVAATQNWDVPGFPSPWTVPICCQVCTASKTYASHKFRIFPFALQLHIIVCYLLFISRLGSSFCQVFAAAFFLFLSFLRRLTSHQGSHYLTHRHTHTQCTQKTRQFVS